ncbi:MAG TPA: hypothetical protein DCQ64_00450 [Candidatus Rokubacteria bacterium]|nr:hypothetical protein [Candidatus Rokubacteria bacterium]
MPLTLVFPADRPGDATYASLAAQTEAGLVRVVQERRTGHGQRWTDRPFRSSAAELDRRLSERPIAREHGQRGLQRRQAVPLPVGARLVVTP